jgi:hypothetical protein
MYKKAGVTLVACLLSVAVSGPAHAEWFDFDPGIGNIYDPDLAGSGGHPYDWYYQGINLEFSGGFNDGRENTSYQDDPYGNIPYVVFDGTDKSTAGHCLQLVFGGPLWDSIYGNAVHNLRFSYTDSSGNDQMLFNTDTSVSTYNVVRVWIKNTGSTLYWRTKIADLDGNNGSWNQSASMNIWRLDQNQADCTTNTLSNFPTLTYVTIIGQTGNYQVCEGELNQSTGLPVETCHAGG